MISFLKLFRSGLYENWWVVTIAIGILLFTTQAIQGKKSIYAKLAADFKRLEKEYKCSVKYQQDLLSKIKSHEDIEWLEMVLKKKLGVVSEGELKVHFQK